MMFHTIPLRWLFLKNKKCLSFSKATFRKLEGIHRVVDKQKWRLPTSNLRHHWPRWMTMSTSKSRAEKDYSHTMGDSYKDTSGNQYSAHLGCQDMLLSCAARLKEQRNQQRGLSRKKILKIADLGSADGSNSIRTIDVFLDALNGHIGMGTNDCMENGTSDLHIVFEEHPSSDEVVLKKTVESWLKVKNTSVSRPNITCNILMKSFYEPLFEANSIDFCMSYICLHWLNTNDNRFDDGIRGWKRLHLEPDETRVKDVNDFIQVNERTAPRKLKELWKANLADPHLAHFLTLRARELKPGAELLVVMVSDPHGYWKPERSHQSPLLKAMKKCVAEGSLRQKVLEQGIIPYYLRKPEDIRDALKLAQQQQLQNSRDPIHLLEMIDIRQYETLTGEIESDTDDGMAGARELFWAIHGGAIVEAGGASNEEVDTIRNHLVQSFDESYDPKTGVVKGNFIACTFRKKTYHDKRK